jgi:DNA-binding NtrC family response regulator
VTVAPLRHRLDDVPLIVTRVLANMTGHRGVTLSAAALRVVSRYTWPRNIRQLEEALQSALMKRPVGKSRRKTCPATATAGRRACCRRWKPLSGT